MSVFGYPTAEARDLVDRSIASAVAITSPDRMVDINRAFVLSALNEALRKIERAGPWKFAEATAYTEFEPAQFEATLPPDLAVPLKAVNATTGSELIFLDLRQSMDLYKDLNAINAQPQVEGQPTYYGVWGRQMQVAPIPRKAVQINVRYYRYLPALEDEDDEVPLPVTYHDLLVNHAVGTVLLRMPAEGDRFLPASAAEPWFAKFQEGLFEMQASPLSSETLDAVNDHRMTEDIAERHW